MNSELNIYSYSSYRQFLQEHYDLIKSKNPSWSYQAWALKLGLKNNTSILKILKGEREAGKKVQQKISKYFNFTEDEEKFFSYLVKLSKSSRHPEKSKLVRDLIKSEFSIVTRQTISEKYYSVFSHWINIAIRQSTKLKSMDFNSTYLKSHLIVDVSQHKIDQALKNLTDLGLLSIENFKNKILWKKNDSGLKTPDDVISQSVQNYHKSVLDLSKEAITKVPVEQREFSAVTMAIKTKDLPRAKKFLRDKEEEFCSLFDCVKNDADEIYQFNIQLFPITNFKSKENECSKTY